MSDQSAKSRTDKGKGDHTTVDMPDKPKQEKHKKEKHKKEKHKKEKPKKDKAEKWKFHSKKSAKPSEDYKKVKVMLFTFEFSELSLKNETRNVTRAFESLGYEVLLRQIKMDNALDNVKEQLKEFLNPQNDTLFIVHYNGHGGITENNMLSLVSHNYPDNVEDLWRMIHRNWGKHGDQEGLTTILRNEKDPFQPIAEVHWSDISPTIMDAECDTLVILDCCNAGLAAVSSQNVHALDGGKKRNAKLDEYEKENPYRKELIGACGWDIDTRNHMSSALFKVMKVEFPAPRFSTMSTPTLVRRMNYSLVQHIGERRSPPQAVHYILQRNGKDKMTLPRLNGHIVDIDSSDDGSDPANEVEGDSESADELEDNPRHGPGE
ncbi:uncharacterized protein BDZ99DRAFT_526801 [Mytilinidion resinicola]|uniref:Peptidase C14 caspase domain-containing protein n=1 Tax=Mytilinidion resinicola TaxID=574789 RepID=A0A6A6Y499_9PEZI|nr:uncharacterized protein BDZ99DRAFT_526801 [Mytilinidion resinicola]KAF2803055.1 hypothetical protein BDZ99DRAFT_526801 [Mytilinidion resinicola]